MDIFCFLMLFTCVTLRLPGSQEIHLKPPSDLFSIYKCDSFLLILWSIYKQKCNKDTFWKIMYVS